MEETHPCVLYRGWCGGGRFAEARRTRGTKGQNRGGSLGWWPSNWGHRSTKRFPGGTGRGPGVRASTSETSSPKMVCRGAPGPPLPASLGGGRTSPLRASLAVHAGSGAHAGCCEFSEGQGDVAGGARTLWVTPSWGRLTPQAQRQPPFSAARRPPDVDRAGKRRSLSATAGRAPEACEHGRRGLLHRSPSSGLHKSHVPRSLPAKTNPPPQPGFRTSRSEPRQTQGNRTFVVMEPTVWPRLTRDSY